MRQPRFDVVRTAAGWHARFRAANGQVVWVTESYTRRRAAFAAIRTILEPHYAWVEDGAVVSLQTRDSWNKANRPMFEVREVDER